MDVTEAMLRKMASFLLDTSEWVGAGIQAGAWHTTKMKNATGTDAGLVVISLALTPDLRSWGTLLGPLGTLMSPCLAG